MKRLVAGRLVFRFRLLLPRLGRWQRRAIAFCLTLLLIGGWHLVEGRSSLAQTQAAQVAQSQVGAIAPQTINGRLDQNSDTLEDGSYYNTHTFKGVAGQVVAIDLSSDEFDTFLALRDLNGNEIAANDDSDGTNSRVVITLPATGTYTIIANSYAAGEQGSYTLTIRAASQDDVELAEADRLDQQIVQLYEQGRYADALPLAQRALDIRERILDANHPDVATSLNNLAELYRAQGNYAQAEPRFQRSLSIREAALGAEHPDVALALNNLALLYQDQGNYAQAELLYRRSLSIREAALGAEHPDVATSLNNLALLYRAQGNYAQAEPLYRRSLSIREAALGANHPAVAQSLNNLALLYRAQGNYAQAEPLYRRSLSIYETVLDANHPDVATSLNNLASLYHAQGNYAQAEPLYERSLSIREAALGAEHPLVATSLNNLALLYRAQGNYAQAEPLYRRSLSIREAALGTEHPAVALALNNLAELYQEQGNYAQAEPLFQRSLSILGAALGAEHPDVAQSLNNLALLYHVQGNYAQAEPLLQRSLSIRETALGANHPAVATSLNSLAGLYHAQGNSARAVEWLQRGVEVEETNLALTLSIGSEPRKLAYLALLRGTTNAAISLHLQAETTNPQAADLALTTLLRRKGRVLSALTDERERLRQNLTPPDQQLLDQLLTAEAELSALTASDLSRRAPEQYRAQVIELETQAEQLANQLAQRSAEFRVETQPVTLNTIQALIPADAALVELVQYKPFNARATAAEQWGAPRYAAYVLHRTGSPQAVDLGAAAAIDPQIEQLRQVLRSPARSVHDAARQLDESVMRPIRSLLGDSTHLLISPDSQLNLIPFAALVDETDRYLVDRYTLTYLTSGRDLLKLQNSVASRQSPVVFANPDYDNPGSTQVAQISTQPALSAQRSAESDRRSVDLAELSFGALAGTQLEAEAIAPLLPNVTLLTQTAATEANLKQVQAPSILHIATHGFFLQDVDCTPATDSRGSFAETGGVGIVPLGDAQEVCRPTESNTENPLLRSGLALAGFNARQSGGEDGVLTALEAAGLNLTGTRLVVLSACETGLGDVANGEGVYGLRRAFVMAGAESQLMSLWKVDDYGTSELMSLYYDRLLRGEGRSEALRQVQRELLQAPAYQHPYYWASFIFSGNWRAIDRV